jgi:hypothetical protein
LGVVVRGLANEALGTDQILGTTPVRSELVWLLVTLDKEYTKADPDVPWPQWYAERIVAQLGEKA